MLGYGRAEDSRDAELGSEEVVDSRAHVQNGAQERGDPPRREQELRSVHHWIQTARGEFNQMRVCTCTASTIDGHDTSASFFLSLSHLMVCDPKATMNVSHPLADTLRQDRCTCNAMANQFWACHRDNRFF